MLVQRPAGGFYGGSHYLLDMYGKKYEIVREWVEVLHEFYCYVDLSSNDLSSNRGQMIYHAQSVDGLIAGLKLDVKVVKW